MFFTSLIAVLAQGLGHGLDHASIQNRQSTKITSSLGTHPNVSVAFAAAAVHDLARSRDAETLLGGFVGLHFVGHEITVM